MQTFLSKEVNMDDIIGIMKEKLDSGGKVTFTPSGTSMLPMLRDGEDVVVLEKPKGRLHLYDVTLYRRDNGQYVLHRVVNFESDGCYVMRGDNQFTDEHGIADSQIIGVVKVFFHKGRSYPINSFLYRQYIKLWMRTKLIRRCWRFIFGKIKNIFGIGKGKKKSDEKNFN